MLEVPDGADVARVDHQRLTALVASEDLRAGLTESVRYRLREAAWRDEAIAVLSRRMAELSSDTQTERLMQGRDS